MKVRNKRIVMLFTALLSLYLMGEFINHFIFGFPIWLFVTIPLFLIPFVGAIGILIFIVVEIVKNRKLKGNLFPVVLSVLLIIIMSTQPFSPILRKAEFSYKFEHREEIAKLVLNGELEAVNVREDLFSIPNRFKSSSLSDGKEVMKMKGRLFFFTSRGVLDNFSGYVYSPNGGEPRDEDVNAKIVKKQRMNKNWYYISCT